MRRRHPDLLALAGLLVTLGIAALPGPTFVRSVPVVAYLVVVPAFAVARHAPAIAPASRLAAGLGGAMALVVLVSQAFLYAGDWSPFGILAVVGLVSVVLLALPARRAGHANRGRTHVPAVREAPRHIRR